MFRLFFILLFCAPFAMGQQLFEGEALILDSTKRVADNFTDPFLVNQDSLFSFHGKKGHWSILPEAIAASQDNNFSVMGGFALQGKFHWGKALDLWTSLRAGYTNAPDMAYVSTLQTRAFFKQDLKKGNYLYQDPRFRLRYAPNQYVQLQTGLDKQQLGQGERSLLLGDFGVANPFLMLKVNLWKLEYVNLQQIWREGTAGHFVPKGNSTHVLQFKHRHHFSVGIFESVTHILKDTLYNRGFDPEYLNPLTFYRTQEYSLGSSDNVVLGVLAHAKWGNCILYTQLVLDEFLLSEIRARSKWWANKYGAQLGFKWAKISDKRSWFLRSEWNIVRPYTYAHLNTGLNFGNQSLPSAHPLGANFVEWFNELAVKQGPWSSQLWLQLYYKGIDPASDSLSYGGDIYQSYINRPLGDYGIKIGAGQDLSVLQIGNKSTYQWKKTWFEFFVEPRLLITHTGGTTQTQFWLSFGFQSRLGMLKRNF